jgi:hypothetical protein
MKLPYKIGTYSFCHLATEIYLIEGFSSSFNSEPNKGTHPRIDIGADQTEWWHIIDALLHETMEQAMVMFGYAYVCSAICARNSTTYSFHLTHGEFIKCHEEVSYLMAIVLPDLAKAWDKYKREKK